MRDTHSEHLITPDFAIKKKMPSLDKLGDGSINLLGHFQIEFS
jgi:hypothetical protein